MSIADVLRNGRIPSAEKIRAKGNHVFRFGEIQRRQLIFPKAEHICAPHHVVAEELKRQRRRRAEQAGELRNQIIPASAALLRQNCERLLMVRRAKRIELRDQFGQRLFPGNLFKLAIPSRACALERMPDTVGMIGNFPSGLSARAELSLIDRMIGIAFQLLGQSHLRNAEPSIANDFGVTFHDSNRQPAAGRAKRADARLPNSNARDESVFGNKTDEVIFRIATAGERGACACECGEFYEFAAAHIFNAINNDR